MFKNKVVIFIVLLVVVLVSVRLVFFSKPSTQQGPQAAGKPGAGKGMPVNGILVTGSDLEETVFTTGSVLANESVELRPEISGKVVGIYFKEGSAVKQGDLLVKLYDADLKAQLSKLESNLKLLKETSERQKKLFELDGISKQEYDESLNQVAAVEADLSFTRAQIEKTEIIAPFNGKVGLRNISQGSFVNQNFLIATIQQLDPVKVDFSLPEKYSGQVNTGQEITFTLAGDNVIHTASVFAIEPMVDAATRSIKLRALAPNKDNKILPGSFAQVKYTLSHSSKAILIPTQAIIPILKGKKVMVARNGIAISQNIVTGIRKNKEVEVVSGLSAGDTVITSGIMQLRDSMQVNVKVFD